jgi:hypothetical protein
LALDSRTDPRVRLFHSQRFCLRKGEAPPLLRASGDSGFVAHLGACTQGATGWDWSFRLVRNAGDWANITDGKVTLYVDEPRQYVPAGAKPGDQVALRLPRVRENLFPHRFTLNGGQGPVVVAHGFTKFFIPLTFDAAAKLVETAVSRMGDQLRFSLHFANSPADYERADSAVLDVGAADLQGVLRFLQAFLTANPEGVVPKGLPHATTQGPLNLATATGVDRGDLADGYGWRRCFEAVSREVQEATGS